MTKLYTLTIAVALAAGSVAQAQPADTTHISRAPLFTSKDAWVAAGFVAGTLAMYPADRYFARKLQATGNQENQFLKNTANDFRFMGTPGSLYIGVGMYGIGRLAKVDRMADLGLHGTEALLIASSTVYVIKGLAGRGRPELNIKNERNFALARGFRHNNDLYRSFPSGHSAAAAACWAAVALVIGYGRSRRTQAALLGAAVVIAVAVAFRQYMKTEGGRRRVGGIGLALPMVGDLMVQGAMYAGLSSPMFTGVSGTWTSVTAKHSVGIEAQFGTTRPEEPTGRVARRKAGYASAIADASHWHDRLGALQLA